MNDSTHPETSGVKIRLFDKDVKDIFENYTKKIKDISAITSFLYLYCFASADVNYTTLIEVNNVLFIMFQNKNEKTSASLFLIGKKDNGDIQNSINTLNAYFSDKNISYYIRAYDDFIFKEKGLCNITEDIDAWEYLYSAEDLQNLEARKYHPKRNHTRQFKKLYPNATVEMCSQDNIAQTKDFLINWQPRASTPDAEEEKQASIKSLDFIKNPNYEAIIIKDCEKVIGFSAALILNPTTALIMFEKADIAYKGIYSFINQTFVKTLPSTIKTINRDRDEGIEGLRKAKLSYYPSNYKKVYRIEACPHK